MRPISRLLPMTGLAAGLLLVAAACSSATATPSSAVLGATSAPGSTTSLSESTSPTLGTYLTGKDGFTLYFFANDSAGVSTCSGSCATLWPPLTVSSGATITGPADATAGFGTIVRDDGTTQVTYDQHPLYYYSGDSVAGDTTGQGYKGIWFVALVSGRVGSAAPSSGASAMASQPAASPSAPSGY
jgi:predicted lipoprotein with Yx(FWY)xxD motif